MNKDAIKELSSNALDIALDANLDEGILKDIPIFGSVIKVAELTMSIRDYFFLKKLGRFIYQLDSLTETDKETIHQFSKSPDSEKIASKVIQVIDNVTDIEKADLIGKLFASFCTGKIDRPNFLRSVDTIHNYFIEDLNRYLYESNVWFETFEDLEMRNLESLVGSPLIKEQLIDPQELTLSGREDEIGITKYENSSFGEIFKKALT
ncbi:hypothetical protein ACE1OE_23710 [Vibrio sp. E150_011]